MEALRKKRNKIKKIKLVWTDERIEEAIKLYLENKEKAEKRTMVG